VTFAGNLAQAKGLQLFLKPFKFACDFVNLFAASDIKNDKTKDDDEEGGKMYEELSDSCSLFPTL